jgi:hypothetical protein
VIDECAFRLHRLAFLGNQVAGPAGGYKARAAQATWQGQPGQQETIEHVKRALWQYIERRHLPGGVSDGFRDSQCSLTTQTLVKRDPHFCPRALIDSNVGGIIPCPQELAKSFGRVADAWVNCSLYDCGSQCSRPRAGFGTRISEHLSQALSDP